MKIFFLKELTFILESEKPILNEDGSEWMKELSSLVTSHTNSLNF